MFKPKKMCLPSGYKRNPSPQYFEDSPSSGGVWQPDVYEFARTLALRLKSGAVVDLGCGNGGKLANMDLGDLHRRVGVDFKGNLEEANRSPAGRACLWVNHDLNLPLPIEELMSPRSFVIVSDVIEHLTNPHALLRSLKRGADLGLIEGIVFSTPDRDRARGMDDLGPPANRAHAQEWSYEEFRKLLESEGLSPAVHGWTRNHSSSTTRNTQLAFVWPRAKFEKKSMASLVRAGAVVPMYNEADVITSTIQSLRDQRIEVHVLDNWSTDGSFEIVEQLSNHDHLITLERFPSGGATPFFEWSKILQRIETVATGSGWDWALHVDSDELIESPLPDLGILEALTLADGLGFDLLDFTLIEYRPTSGHESYSSMESWEFVSRPGARNLQRAWQIAGPEVSIHNSGGHRIENRNDVFPLNFLLKHYPLRGADHAKRKIFLERLPRFGEEKKLGWHRQYDTFNPNHTFIWSSSDLNPPFSSDLDLIAAYLPEVTTRAGLSFN